MARDNDDFIGFLLGTMLSFFGWIFGWLLKIFMMLAGGLLKGIWHGIKALFGFIVESIQENREAKETSADTQPDGNTEIADTTDTTETAVEEVECQEEAQ